MSSYQCYFVIHITFPEAPRVKEFYPMTRESVVVSKVEEKKKVSPINVVMRGCVPMPATSRQGRPC